MLLHVAASIVGAFEFGFEQLLPVALRVERGAGFGESVGGAASLGLRGVQPLAGGLGFGVGAFALGLSLGLNSLGLGEGFFRLGDASGQRLDLGAQFVGAEGVGLGLAVEPFEGGLGGGAAFLGEPSLGLGLPDLLGVCVESALLFGELALPLDQGRAERFALGLALLELRRPLRHLVFERVGLGVERAALRGEPLVVGGGEAQFELAEARLQRGVALGFLGLAAEAADVLLDLVREVGQPREVGLRGVEAAEGLVAALLVLRDPSGLLEQPPPVVGVLREDVLDHLQLDDRIRARAHARVHEQVEDVLQPADGPVEQVLGLARAVETAADGDVGVLGGEDVAGVLDG